MMIRLATTFPHTSHFLCFHFACLTSSQSVLAELVRQALSKTWLKEIWDEGWKMQENGWKTMREWRSVHRAAPLPEDHSIFIGPGSAQPRSRSSGHNTDAEGYGRPLANSLRERITMTKTKQKETKMAE